jgi:hypothetical protein
VRLARHSVSLLVCVYPTLYHVYARIASGFCGREENDAEEEQKMTEWTVLVDFFEYLG